MEENQNITIRYANNDDYPYLKTLDSYISVNKIENGEIYIAETSAKIIGWLRYNFFWDSVPFMNMIYFLDDYRGKGLGRKLVKRWEEDMKQKGFKNVLTSTQSDEQAQHFYRKLGYREIGGFKYLNDPYEIIFHKEI